MSRIIGLSGYAQSGKDSVAEILAPQGFTRVAFADSLKELALAVNPIVVPEFTLRLSQLVDADGWEGAKRRTEVRELLQRLGAGARNVLRSDIWITTALLKMPLPGDYVITDVRYPNEGAAIEGMGGVVWRVNRPGVGPVNSDDSETAMDGYAFAATINNSGTLEDLAVSVATELAALG